MDLNLSIKKKSVKYKKMSILRLSPISEIFRPKVYRYGEEIVFGLKKSFKICYMKEIYHEECVITKITKELYEESSTYHLTLTPLELMAGLIKPKLHKDPPTILPIDPDTIVLLPLLTRYANSKVCLFEDCYEQCYGLFYCKQHYKCDFKCDKERCLNSTHCEDHQICCTAGCNNRVIYFDYRAKCSEHKPRQTCIRTRNKDDALYRRILYKIAKVQFNKVDVCTSHAHINKKIYSNEVIKTVFNVDILRIDQLPNL
jgi:hypothetical protein